MGLEPLLVVGRSRNWWNPGGALLGRWLGLEPEAA
jgi:hypothetical protein